MGAFNKGVTVTAGHPLNPEVSLIVREYYGRVLGKCRRVDADQRVLRIEHDLSLSAEADWVIG